MTIKIDLRDRIQLNARRKKYKKNIKRVFKIALYGYIGTRVLMGGIDGIIQYGKATAIFKGIDVVVAKIIK